MTFTLKESKNIEVGSTGQIKLWFFIDVLFLEIVITVLDNIVSLPTIQRYRTK